jgi:tRNA(fMet)-specific endonuclease VapC
MYLIDSDVIINYLRGKKEYSEIVKSLDSELSTTILNIFELYNGAYKSTNVQKNIDLVSSVINSLRILDLDNESTQIAARISSELEKTGNSLPEMDVLIASISIRNNCILVTGNKKHFSRIKGIKILEVKV